MSATTRTGAAVLAALVIAAACVACNDNDEPKADPTESAPSSAPSSSAPTAEPTGPLADYTDEERAAYGAAVATLERRIKIEQRVYRTGKATPAARDALARVYTSERLATEWQGLQESAKQGFYLRGTRELVSTRPIRILMNDGSGSVDVRACIDSSQLRVYKRGVGEVESTATNRAAFKIKVDLGADGAWRISDTEELGKC